MKYIIALFITIYYLSASYAECVSADPDNVFTSVGGDFELYVDGSDIIIAANVGDGASSIKIAKIDGNTGNIVNGSLKTVADNFSGLSSKNGPEWVKLPNGAVGILYAGGDGVHGVFRQASPSSWDDFTYDINGDQLPNLHGPLITPTGTGQYPAFEIPGLQTYSSYFGNCTSDSLCVGTMGQGSYTDLVPALDAQGITGLSAALSPREGYVFVAGAGPNGLGIYEAQIDGNGGFTDGTIQKLTSVNGIVNRVITADKHPVTGTSVVFVKTTSTQMVVFEQPAAGGPLTQIANLTASCSSHYTTKKDSSKLILAYYSGTAYELPITSSGGVLQVGTPKSILPKTNGTEISLLPTANQWNIFYRNTSNVLQRCPFTP